MSEILTFLNSMGFNQTFLTDLFTIKNGLSIVKIFCGLNILIFFISYYRCVFKDKNEKLRKILKQKKPIIDYPLKSVIVLLAVTVINYKFIMIKTAIFFDFLKKGIIW